MKYITIYAIDVTHFLVLVEVETSDLSNSFSWRVKFIIWNVYLIHSPGSSGFPRLKNQILQVSSFSNSTKVEAVLSEDIFRKGISTS